MPLHDAVGINCKKGATTENQGSGVNYRGQGVYGGGRKLRYIIILTAAANNFC